MESNIPTPNTTKRVDDKTELLTEAEKEATYARTLSAPVRGLAVFVPGNITPFAVQTEAEFILGRKTGEVTDPLLDLTNLEGFAKGVSRRHAMIRTLDNGYVIIDLNSSNGTWLNGQRLLPARENELSSGSSVQLGRLKLIFIFQSPAGHRK